MFLSDDSSREKSFSFQDEDFDKIREAAFSNGIPCTLRSCSWKILFGLDDVLDSNSISIVYDLVSPCSSPRVSKAKLKYENSELEDIRRKARLTVKRYQRKVMQFSDTPELLNILENVIDKYHQKNINFLFFTSSDLVYLAGPLVYNLQDEYHSLWILEKLVQHLEYELKSSNALVLKFLMLIRAMMPDIYSLLENEEVDARHWADCWIKLLLSKNLPLNCLVRLWDSYFIMINSEPSFKFGSNRSVPGGFSLLEFHVFVCLSIIKKIKDDLEELEGVEILSCFLQLPSLDINEIIREAINLQQEATKLNII